MLLGFEVFVFHLFLLYLLPCFFDGVFPRTNKKRQTTKKKKKKKKQRRNIGAKTNKNKGIFLIEMNGNSVSWTPAKAKNAVQLWQNLRLTVERHFAGVKLNKNSIIVCNDDNDNDISQCSSSQLRLNTIESYCSRLMTTSDNSTMRFHIKMLNSIINNTDNSDVKLVRIMSVHENKYDHNGILYFDENENAGIENYDSIIEYVNKMYDITVDNEKHSALPYTIRKIERDDYKHIESSKSNVNVNMDDMAEVDRDDFEECYDSDDSTNGRECALLIQIHEYILFTMNGKKQFIWIPHDGNANSKNDNVDWKLEYKRAHDLVRNHFQIESSYDIQFQYESVNGSALIGNENDFAQIWNKLVQSKSTDGAYVEIVATTVKNTNVVGEVFVFVPSFLMFFFHAVFIFDFFVIWYFFLVVVCFILFDVAQADRSPLPPMNGDKELEVSFEESKKNDVNNVEQEMKYLLNKLARLRDNDKNSNNNNNNNSSNNNSEQQSRLDSLSQLFDHLFESLALEGFSENGSVFKHAISSKNAMLQSKWEASFKHLKNGLIIVEPFNIEYMLDLYDKTEHAAKQVLNEDAVIVLGHTGAGKSTTIHFLAGSKMVRDKKTGHIYPDKITNKALSNVKTEFRMAESVTRYIAGVPISLEDAGIRISSKDNAKNKMVLCDTPGFDDTSGAEVDVANGLGIIRAVSLAKEAKILLVIGRADLDGSRMRGAKQLCYTLANIMPDFQHFLNCINIVVTKMSGIGNSSNSSSSSGDGTDAIDMLETWFDQALKDMKDKGENNDEAVVALFDHVLENLESVIVLDPIKDKQKLILSKLFKKETNWIPYPKEQFQPFVTESSMDKIMQQILKHKQSILNSSTNYELIDYKLTQLKRLHQVLPSLKDIDDIILECIESVCKSWNNECNNCISRLKTSVSQHPLNEFENDIEYYKNSMMHFEQYNNVRRKHLISSDGETTDENNEQKRNELNPNYIEKNDDMKDENKEEMEPEATSVGSVWSYTTLKHPAISPDLLTTVLARQFDVLIAKSNTMTVDTKEEKSETMHEVKDEVKNSEKLDSEQQHQQQQQEQNEKQKEFDAVAFEKARLIGVYFESPFKHKYEKKLNSLRQEIVGIGKQATKSIDNNNFETFCSILSKLYFEKDSHDSIGDPCKINDTILSVETYLSKFLTAITKKLSALFPLSVKFDPVKPESVLDQANSHFGRLESACAALSKSSYIPMNCDVITNTNSMYEETLEALVKYCNLLCNHIRAELWSSNDDVSSKTSSNSNNNNGGNYSHVSTKHKMRQMKSYVEFLKAIRSISEEIKARTLDSYHYTLREIETFLSSIEREFERIVRNLDRNITDLNIDYGDLVECVTILKDSDWLFDVGDRYNDLEAVTTDDKLKISKTDEDVKHKAQMQNKHRNVIVKNVISKLVSHFDVLRNISDNNNINLENVSSLDTVELVMKQLNKMKPLERLIPEITEMSSNLAVSVIQDVKGILQSMVPNSDEKQDEKQGGKENVATEIWKKKTAIALLNKKKATVQKIEFVKRCCDIRWFEPTGPNVPETVVKKPIKQQTRNALDELKGHLSIYCDLRVNKMKECLDFLVNIECELSNTGKAMECGSNLSEILTELVQIDTKYPVIMKYLDEDNDDLLEHWRLKLNESFKDLSAKLVKLKNTDHITLHMAVTRAYALSKIDWFLQTSKFGDLYIGYEKQFRSDAGYVAIVNCIKEEKFEEIEQHMSRMQKKINVSDKTTKETLDVLYQQAQTLLTRMLDDLYDTARNHALRFHSELQLSKPDKQYFETLSKLLKRTKASQCCNTHLTKTNKREIEKRNKEIWKLLQDCVKRGEDNIESAINSKQFDEAEKQIDSLDFVSRLINIPFDLQGIINKLDLKLDSEKKWYLETDFAHVTRSPYYSNPPKDLHEAIHRANKRCKRTKYTTIWKDIEKDIVNKFRARLSTTRNIVNRQQRKDTFQLCNFITTSLPTRLSDLLYKELTNMEDEIEAIEESEAQIIYELKAKKNTWDYNELSETYYAKVKENRFDLVTKLKKLILQRMLQRAEQVSNYLRKRDAQSVYELMCKTYNIWLTFSKQEKQFEAEIRKKLKLAGALHTIHFSNRNQIVDICEIVNKSQVPLTQDRQRCSFDKNVNFIAELFAASQNSYHPNYNENGDKGSTLGHWINPVLKCRNNLIKKFKLFFRGQTENCQNGLVKFDCKALVDVLTAMRLYSPARAEYLHTMDFYGELKSTSKVHEDDMSGDQDNDGAVVVCYFSEISKQIVQFLDHMRDGICKEEFINQRTDLNSTTISRVGYYVELKHRFQFLNNCAKNQCHMLRSLLNDGYCADCIDKAKGEVNAMCDFITKIVNESHAILFNEQTLMKINLYLINLDAIEEVKLLKYCDMKSFNSIKGKIGGVKNKLSNFFSALALGSRDLDTMDAICRVLIDLCKASNIIYNYKEVISLYIDRVLKHHVKQGTSVGAFFVALEEMDRNYGGMLVASSSIFKGENTSKFNKLTNDRGIEYVLSHMCCGDGINTTKLSGSAKTVLENRFKTFEKHYARLIDQNLSRHVDTNRIIGNIKTIAARLKREIKKSNPSKEMASNQVIQWNSSIKTGAIELMAHVVGLWTLQNSKYYFEVGDVDDKKSYLSQPRAAQIVSIIRLLNIDNVESKLASNLIEIGTGEGKSFTLAITACILALVGYNVNCVCYSTYLCDRDYAQFSELFRALRVMKKINYGTLRNLCEMTIKSVIDVRQSVKDFVLGKHELVGAKNINTKSGPKFKHVRGRKHDKSRKSSKLSISNDATWNRIETVLLLDEVDVLFSNEFYSRIYKPSTSIKSNEISQLTDFIWQNRYSVTTLKRLQQTDIYKQIQNMFKEKWMLYVDRQIKKMINDSKNMKGFDYVVKDGKIGHKQLDSINFTTKMGYKTMFAHYKEYGNNSISLKTLNSEKSLRIRCCKLSFVEICKQFDALIGVTGTLCGLSKLQVDVVKETFGVNKFTYMPSIFGTENKLTFNPIRDIKLYDKIDYYESLKDEIRMKLSDHAGGKRCVFVFFENSSKLLKFYNCGEFGPLRDNALCMTEENNKAEKESIIKRACMSGAILLASKLFGRGTDFQVRDKIVANNGGPHVIQAFLSEEKTEEKQIQGRTARQGGVGSYSMILLKDEIQNKYNVSEKDINNAKRQESVYHLLDEKRSKYFQLRYERLGADAKIAAFQHQISERLITALMNGQDSQASQLLEKINE